MSLVNALIFGHAEPSVAYTERRAAYVVIFNGSGEVATVRAGQKHFLPGGGSLRREAAEETIVREVREELARSVRLIRRIGEAVQYFYSDADGRHYKMLATFFAGEFTDEMRDGACEHELHWLPLEEAERELFHACHVWAARQA
jgi:8-oxo-dGTP diphosphatase